MLRSLYKRLVSWHPSRFRDRFGAEMLSIFDHVDGSKARAVLVADGFLSLLRQWSIRSQFEAEEVLGVPGEGIPAFGTLPSTRLRARLLIDGLILATVVFCLVCLAFQYNWTHPVLIRFTGVQFADETDAEPAGSSSILPVDEALPGQPERQTVTEHSVNQVRTGRASSVATVSKSLLAIFDRYPLLALGEWHDSQGDRELRTDLLHQAGFADKVQNIVLECGNALYQDALDRYVDGEDVPREQIQKVWRDTTQSPVAPETYLSACESFINEARSINRDRNAGKKIRLLAGDPPIDWTKVKTTQDFIPFLQARDSFPAKLIEREVLTKHQRALLVYGGGHIWRKNAMNPTPNLATILDNDFPGQLFTVLRLSGLYPDTDKLEKLIATSDRPVFLELEGKSIGALDANEFIGRDIPVKLFPQGLGIVEVVDACVYTGTAPDTTVRPQIPAGADPAWEAEHNRRRALAPGRRNRRSLLQQLIAGKQRLGKTILSRDYQKSMRGL